VRRWTIEARHCRELGSKSERSLVFDIFFLERPQAVVKIEPPSYDNADTQTEQEENAVSGKADQENGNNHCSREQTSSALD
jgi:hypothetical protein